MFEIDEFPLSMWVTSKYYDIIIANEEDIMMIKINNHLHYLIQYY